jgi:hypothetical protein
VQRFFPFAIPIVVVVFVVGGFSLIGNLLLFVGKQVAVPLALGLALGVGFVCMLLSFRAARLPPVELPGEPVVEAAPRRRPDLGLGPFVGQFVGFFVMLLILLIVVLALKHH